jgi:hypothetical protein
MLVSEVMGKAGCKRYSKPKQMLIPGPTKSKPRPKPKKRAKPKPFNTPKPDELS